jgi:glycine C-acetyltransferase
MSKDVMGFIDEELQELHDSGLYNEIRTLDSDQGAWVTIRGKKVLNLCSNNYLGLAADPDLVEAAQEAAAEYGVGPGAVRTIAGTMDIHLELERKLAEFKGAEASIVFQSGFNANLATIPCLVGRGDTIYSDALNHASIIDGCRLSRADIKVYEHNNMDSLRETLEGEFSGKRLIITDGVFSMDGDLAKLPEIVELAKEYNAMTYVDDAHGEGVLGSHGRGIVDHYGLHGEVDVEMGTLSKAFGVVGGFTAGSARLIEFLQQRARPFLFSTGLTPMDVAANIAAVEKLSSSDELVTRLWDNARYFKKKLSKLGFDTGQSETPITPVIIGEADVSAEFSSNLFEEGIFAQSIGFPTVPRGTARIRVMISAAHSKEDLDFAVEKFEEVGRDMELI